MAEPARGLDYGSPPMSPFFYEAPVSFRAGVFWDCSIGAHSHINGGQIREYTDIGRFCTFAHNVAIGVSDHALHLVSTHPWASHGVSDGEHVSPYKSDKARAGDARTTIGHDVWIGINAIVRAGVTIGVGAVVGAGAVVTTDVPPYAIVVGAPAKIIKYRFPEEVRLALLASEWWDYPIELLSKLPANNIQLFLEKLAASDSPRANYDWVKV